MKKSISTNAIVPSEEWYDKTGLAYEKGYSHNAGLINIMKAFLGHLNPMSSVLDCGCGTGKPVAEMVVQQGHRVHGIDWSQTMVQLCKQQVPNGTFEHVNMLEFKPKESFDGIVAMLSLFELSRQEIESMAEKWGRWISPGGHILLGVFGAEDCDAQPEHFDTDGKFAGNLEFRFMKNIVSMGIFTKTGWDELLQRQGFEVISRTTDVFSPPAEVNSDDEPDYYVIAKKVK